MTPEKTIQLTRLNPETQAEETVDVHLRYCAATEIGFGTITDNKKTVDVFNPKIETIDGKAQVAAPPQANDDDYIKLVMSAILAAYEARCTETERVDPPLTMKDIILRSTRPQVMAAVQAVMELRLQWLGIPTAIRPETDEESEKGKKRKNVKTPTTTSKRS